MDHDKTVTFYRTYCKKCKAYRLFVPTNKIMRTADNRVGYWYDCLCGHSILLIGGEFQ